MNRTINKFSKPLYTAIIATGITAVSINIYYTLTSIEIVEAKTGDRDTKIVRDNNINISRDIDENDLSITYKIVGKIKANRTIDIATTGKLYSKVLANIQLGKYYSNNTYLLTPADVDELMLASYVYIEESDYWADYSIKMHLM